MKNIARILMLSILVTVCFSSAGCTLFKSWSKGNTEFRVTIDDVTGIGEIDFEITSKHIIRVKLHNEGVGDETYKDIDIKYNQENAVITYAYERGYQSEIVFNAYFYELGEDDELSFTYKGKTVKVKYNVVDYDFSDHGYVDMDSIDDLDKYPEFKNMILSVTRHEFKEPYAGLDELHMSTFTDVYGETVKSWSLACASNENDPDYIATDYLPYLKDSVYYPAKFDMVHENPISSINVSMGLPMSADTSEGACRESMRSFGISYSVIDPCCTNPQHPLRQMSFYASDKEKAMTYANSNVDDMYPSAISILLERYPERFFVTKLGDITVNILISNETGALAYFEDETYFYSLSANYSDE